MLIAKLEVIHLILIRWKKNNLTINFYDLKSILSAEVRHLACFRTCFIIQSLKDRLALCLAPYIIVKNEITELSKDWR